MTREGFLKHGELIEAWANGCDIEYLGALGKWVEVPDPSWSECDEYRIKQFQPNPGDKVLVQDDCMDNWVERVFVGWQDNYPLAIRVEIDGTYKIEDETIRVDVWDRVRELK